MTTLPDLKPAGLEVCPLCGSDNVKLRTDSKAAMSWVACISCGLEAPTETGVSSEEAVAYWNRRAARSTVPEVGKAVDWHEMLAAMEAASAQILASYQTWVADDTDARPRYGQIPRYDQINAAIRKLSDALASVPAPSGAEPVAWRYREAEGMVLVPREPTPEMLGAWYRYKSGFHYHDEPPPPDTSDVGAYAAMLAAAPLPEDTRHGR